MEKQATLEVSNLDITYDTEAGPLHTVRNVSFRIQQGEIFGLVGESGSGKTTLARAIVRYLPANGRVRNGSIRLNGRELLDLSQGEMRRVWGKQITMVHQDPAAAVNPSIRIGEQLAEVARAHLGMSKVEAQEQALEMLDRVRMPDPEKVGQRYAHQLSGGMLQRVLIASALMTNPQLLIMDEATTALDVTTEAVILDLVRDLLEEYQTAVLYITHNLGVIARISDRVGVMYAGELLEEGPIRGVFKEVRHPYTLGLLGCVPRVDASKREIALSAIPGHIPRPDELPHGCIFAPRCAIAEEKCRQERPTLLEVSPSHSSACWRWEEVQRLLGTPVEQKKKTAQVVDSTRTQVVLEARDVIKYFDASGGGIRSLLAWRHDTVKAVDEISIRVREGLTLGIVGESGCGKTTLARCVAGLEEATDGVIELEGEKLPYGLKGRSKEQLKKIQMVFQNPDASLNPVRTVGEIVGRPLSFLGAVEDDQLEGRLAELLTAVQLPTEYRRRLPHELSGGEKQRVAIARAFAANPRLMICDEAISSLDVSVQASLMNLLVELQGEMGSAYLFISHDLAAVRHISDWIVVVYLGRLWETGAAEDVFAPPSHPYTEALLSAIPIPDPDVQQKRIRLEGGVPSAIDIPSGCRFHTRCPRKIGPICENEEPPWREAEDGHRICCHIPLEELAAMQHGVLETVEVQGES
jgi:peptide/nickel transport system ATP-binding protein